MRFMLRTEPVHGPSRMFPEVTVKRQGDELIAISREAAAIGDALVLDVVMPDVDGRDVHLPFTVYVIDSQPVIANGDMKHRLRLLVGSDRVM